MSRISITGGATAGNKRRAATHYGLRNIEDKLPTKHASKQGLDVLEVPFNYDDLPTFGLDEAILRIPQGAVIKRAYIRVTEAFAGGTSVAVGTADAAGTGVATASLVAATTTANLDLDDYVVGGGALVGTALALEKQVTCTAVGTFTAGKATVVVEFEPNYARA